jgi:hypothetical protein
MDWHDLALILAGMIGRGVALIHGALTQRYMVVPFARLAGGPTPLPARSRRLVPALLHFSTFNWFIGGLALILAALWLDGEARLATALLVASSYLFGALANLWGTRGRHPGWMLYGVALVLIGVGAQGG